MTQSHQISSVVGWLSLTLCLAVLIVSTPVLADNDKMSIGAANEHQMEHVNFRPYFKRLGRLPSRLLARESGDQPLGFDRDDRDYKGLMFGKRDYNLPMFG